jgi:uncharacterized protein
MRLLETLLLKLADLQVRRPWAVVLVIAVSLIPAGWAASRLELRTSFSELLPDTKPSVIEMRRIESRLAGMSTLTVVAEGSGDIAALQRFVDRSSPRIRALGPDYVAAVDDGSRAVRAFFEQNKHLYADLEDLQKLRDDVVARYDYEVGKQSGMDLDILDEEDAPEAITPESLEQRFRKKIDEANKATPGVDGYYIGEEGKFAAILVRTRFGSGDQRAFELQAKIQRILDEEKPHFGDPSMRFGFTGNLITSAEQHRAIKGDLAQVGAWGVGMILAVVLLFFLRVRTLWAMTLTIGVGCVWAFAVAKLTVGYLNTATGFLVSIIAGNGINFAIIFMARFIEARRDERLNVGDAIRMSHRDTYGATLAASSAAMVAYGSLAATDFHGFKHFGIIAGAGMILCWVATFSFLPAFLVISERVAPMFHQRERAWRSRIRGVYGYPFALAARRFPRATTLIGVALAIGSFYLTARYFADDPMEYDLANIRNERTAPTSAGKLSVRVDKIVGRLGQDGRAILTQRLDQVEPLVRELERRRDAAPAEQKPFSKVVSIFDLLPKQQDEKLKLLREIDDRLARAKKHGFITDDDWKKLQVHVPDKLVPIGVDELPEQVARPFTEQDGSRGRIVYIVPTEGESVYDARYLMAWADSFRHVELPNGEVILGTGDPVIFSDMLINIREDAPKAILLSLLGTIAVILLAFRGRAPGWLALGTLLVGVAMLVAFLELGNIKLNFLNFVAIPIGIGIGADYAINLLKRRQIEGNLHLYRVLVHTGGAVVLCSLTTIVGYTALLLSINRAVKSFGLAAAVGELTTVVAVMLLLPGILFWRLRATSMMAVPSSRSARTLEAGEQD